VWLTSTITTQAQKLSLDKQKITVPYIKFPTETPIAAKSTYQVVFDISTANFHKLQLKQSEVTRMFQLSGYEYKPEAADFTYQIKVDNPVVIENKAEPVKRGESVEYAAQIKIAIPTTISLIDNATGKAVYSTLISTSQKPTEYKSRSNSYKGSIDKELAKTTGGMHPSVAPIYKTALFDEIKKMKAQYTFQVREFNAVYYTANVKKAPQLSTFNQQIHTVLKNLGEIKTNQPLDAVKAKTIPILKAWEQDLANVKGTEKYHDKLRFLYLYSLSCTYYILEELNAAKQFCGEEYRDTYRYLKELQPLFKASENMEKRFAGSSFNSNYFVREEMEPTQRFEFTAIQEQAPPQKTTLKDMGKEIKDIGKEVAEIGTDAVDIGKDIKETIESIETFEKEVLGDSAYCHTARFSTIRFNANGKKYVFREGKLENGTGNPHPKLGAYSVYITRKPKDIPIYKDIEFYSMSMRFYDANGSLLVDDIVKGLKAYSGQSISDITIRNKPSGDMLPNADGSDAMLIEPNDYSKSLSFELHFCLADVAGGYKDILYMSKNGDLLKYQLDSIRPIVLIHYDGEGEGSKYSQGYMAHITVPSITLEQYTSINTKPYIKFTGEKLIIKDLEIDVLLSDVERFKKM